MMLKMAGDDNNECREDGEAGASAIRCNGESSLCYECTPDNGQSVGSGDTSVPVS